MRTLMLVPLLLAATAIVPTAAAGPDCVQVYPWSELCEGDVVGFVNAVSPCDVDECVTLTSAESWPPVDCIQVVPWSYLCSGNVQAFVEYYTGPLGHILA